MPWLKMSDTAAMHPIVLAVAEHPDADERSVDEVFGLVGWVACVVVVVMVSPCLDILPGLKAGALSAYR